MPSSLRGSPSRVTTQNHIWAFQAPSITGGPQQGHLDTDPLPDLQNNCGTHHGNCCCSMEKTLGLCCHWDKYPRNPQLFHQFSLAKCMRNTGNPDGQGCQGQCGCWKWGEDGLTSTCRHSGLGETHKEDLQDKELKKQMHRSCINPAVKLWKFLTPW